MNLNDIFNIVVLHFIKQRVPSVLPGGSMCRYRTKSGLMCAVGCLIPDEKYSSILEGFSIINEEVQNALPFEITDEKFNFLFRLQQIHDSSVSTCSLLTDQNLSELERVAEEYNLDKAVLEKFREEV